MSTISIEQLDTDIQRIDDQLAGLRGEIQRLEEERGWLASTRESFVKYMEYAGASHRAPAVIVAPPAPSGRQPTATEWAEKVLAGLPPGSLQDTWALIGLMQAAGYETTADKVYLTVYGTLNRSKWSKEKPDGAIVKVGSKWGLRSWYPEGVPPAPRLGGFEEEKGGEPDAD